MQQRLDRHFQQFTLRSDGRTRLSHPPPEPLLLCLDLIIHYSISGGPGGKQAARGFLRRWRRLILIRRELFLYKRVLGARRNRTTRSGRRNNLLGAVRRVPRFLAVLFLSPRVKTRRGERAERRVTFAPPSIVNSFTFKCLLFPIRRVADQTEIKCVIFSARAIHHRWTRAPQLMNKSLWDVRVAAQKQRELSAYDFSLLFFPLL